MIFPYLTVPFSFSESSWHWLQETVKPIAEDYQLNAPSNAALVIPSDNFFLQWNTSAARTELQNFFKEFGLQDGDIQFFIYKKLETPLREFRGNPHIDTARSLSSLKDDAQDVTFRFNILLYGDEDIEMVWWKHNRSSSVIETIEFIAPNGDLARRIQAKGGPPSPKGSRHNQYSLLGVPEFKSNSLAKLNQTASFVRTDILHALNWNGKNPRFILSIRFFQPWAVIENLRHRKSP